MLLLIVSAMVTAGLIILAAKANDDIVQICATLGLGASCAVFIACLIMWGITTNDWMSEQDKIKYIETRKALVYCLETNPDSVRTLASDIATYNSDILIKRRLNKSLWFNLETHDFWDELELIELGNE